ncbi:MAG: ribulose-phosphate 3-epimerase [Planctomycetaceae bacterium]|nr:ribulose-phosphate 3-epimerase [Planctomycetales bacterium]MCB9873817.1 ribulose-phosphate 3-epimerase [Planctomycetaceae bacterium]MCB9940016.1 ribulose-phosphate 3-epimerase [Planctomycetaceae bacterium]
MSRRRHLVELRKAPAAVLPSLLLCDFGNLEREIRQLEAAGVRALHLDVMDGQFVPNLTYGMPIVEACRRLTDLPLDVHLMIKQPQQYIQQFYDAGADIITIHAEAVESPGDALAQIRDRDCGAGLAINPNTSVESIEDCLSLCDLVLVMSVEAGFGGQSFQPVALEKLRVLKQLVDDKTLLEVDGGVNGKTIRDCQAAGAQLLVVGSAIFREPDYRDAVNQLTNLTLTV